MTDSLSLGEFLQGSLERKPSPQTLKLAWRERVLRWAQNRLIDQICFGAGPGHEHCRAFFDSLAEDERETQFFCLGAKNVCHNQVRWVKETGEVFYTDCGHEWYGNWAAACPKCGAEYVPDSLQRLRWYEALITLVAGETQEFRSFAATVTVDLVFRIAQFLRVSGIVALPAPGTVKDYERIALAVRHKMLELGHPASSDVYDACNWAARVPEATDWLGIAPATYETWTRNMQRQFVPVLTTAIGYLLVGRASPALAVAALLAQDKPFPEIVADIMALLEYGPQEESEEPEEDDEEPSGYTGYVLRHRDNPETVVVVVPLPAEALKRFEMQANLSLTDRGANGTIWKAVRELEGNHG